jgi:hypothetical protein
LILQKKEPPALFYLFALLGQLPLTNLLFPAETATRVGTNFACAARDHCSKVCSMGIKEKRALSRLFFLLFPLD